MGGNRLGQGITIGVVRSFVWVSLRIQFPSFSFPPCSILMKRLLLSIDDPLLR